MSSNNTSGSTNGGGSGGNNANNNQLRDEDPNISDGYEAEVESNASVDSQEEPDSESDAVARAPPARASGVLTPAVATALDGLAPVAADILYRAILSVLASDSESSTDSTESEEESEEESEDVDDREDGDGPQGLGLPSRADYLTPGNVNGALEQSHPMASGEARLQDDTCRICLDDLTATDPADIRVIMGCGHRFHGECILEWFDIYPGCHCPCPADRRRLFTNPGHENCGEEHEDSE